MERRLENMSLYIPKKAATLRPEYQGSGRRVLSWSDENAIVEVIWGV